MNLILSFKTFLFLFLVGYGSVRAQAIAEEQEKTNRYYDVLGNAKVGFLMPTGYGNNFLSDGYDTWNGIHLDGKVYIERRISLGIQLQFFKGRVTNQEIVGTVDASRFTHGFVFGSYNPFGKNSDWTLELGLGLGFVDLRNEVGFQRFNDSGFALMAQSELSYRINKWLGLYLLLQNNWDFLSIDAPEEIKKNFNNLQIFAPSAGLKFYML